MGVNGSFLDVSKLFENFMKPTLTIIALFLSLIVFAQKEVGFRGVERSGHFPDKSLLKKWPEPGPELFLKIEGIGKGYSSPIVVNETIYVTGIKEDTIDMLSAYTLDGEMLWDVPYGRSWVRSYIDSRSTPTFQAASSPLQTTPPEWISVSVFEVFLRIETYRLTGGAAR